MELEQALEKIAELEKRVEAESRAKREILSEKKQLQARYETIDPDEHVALQSKAEELTKALEETQKMTAAQIEQMTNELSAKSSALENVLINNGITEALLKANVKPELLDGAKALLISQAKLINEDGEFKALLGDKPVSDAVSEWVQGDQGKHFVKAMDNSGGSAVQANQGDNSGGEDARTAKLAEAKKSGNINEYLAASLI